MGKWISGWYGCCKINIVTLFDIERIHYGRKKKMIQINQLKINVESGFKGEDELLQLKKLTIKKLTKEIKKKKEKLDISIKEIKKLEIAKKSIDARKKEQVHYSYSVKVKFSKEKEEKLCEFLPEISKIPEKTYHFQPCGEKKLRHRPIIVGMGPAGLFLGMMLSQAGYQPIILEQGGNVEERKIAVETFWKTNTLNLSSNVQFGEGGAGTFSDGKLNTMVKDTIGRNRLVLELFVTYGAPSDILYKNKPHIGTDKLCNIVKNMRKRMQELGATIYFHTKMTDIQIENGTITSITANGKQFPCEVLILAIGHSSRDTFSLLKQKQVELLPKPFAIGVRVEHPQEFINQSQYGKAAKYLPAADYKLTHTLGERSIYSFCMCPGGYVVNASSEHGMITVNGMSNYARNGKNANSALITTVTPKDFLLCHTEKNLQGKPFAKNAENKSIDVLSGVEFQRNWERAAFLAGNGKIPIQLYGDLREGKVSKGFGAIQPDIKGNYEFADLRDCLPEYIITSLLKGMEAFDKKIPGYGNPEAIFSGVETRTSSPIRILRNENFESNIKGLYPCGEGAGYAGGITSAAMDGIRIYEAIASNYQPISY